MSVVTGHRLGPRHSAFLRALRKAILAELEPEIVLVERLAVLRACGYKRSEAGRLLGLDQAALLTADKRLKAAARRLDAGDVADWGT